MAEVICNTSPIQYLHQTGYLWLLQDLFKSVTVPTGVVDEVSIGREVGIDLPHLIQLEWISVRSPNHDETRQFDLDLGKGERETILIALESPGSLIVMDDLLGRRTAVTYGIRIKGTLGILLSAKEKGHIPMVRPVLNSLADLGFRLDLRTKQIVLQKAGEDWR